MVYGTSVKIIPNIEMVMRPICETKHTNKYELKECSSVRLTSFSLCDFLLQRNRVANRRYTEITAQPKSHHKNRISLICERAMARRVLVFMQTICDTFNSHYERRRNGNRVSANERRKSNRKCAISHQTNVMPM